MIRGKIEDEYFEWIYRLLFKSDNSYKFLLTSLYNIPFEYTIPMDGNREADGINLRYRFGREKGYEDYVITQDLDICICSVLEMMTALCIRMEEIMECDNRNRTGEWFMEMLCSLGLKEQTNNRFDEKKVNRIISRFLQQKYEKNGKGGLFTVKKLCDMRQTELWYQAQFWMYEHLND